MVNNFIVVNGMQGVNGVDSAPESTSSGGSGGRGVKRSVVVLDVDEEYDFVVVKRYRK